MGPGRLVRNPSLHHRGMLRWESRLLMRKELEAMKSSGERRETTLTMAEEVHRLRLRYGFWIIIITIVSTFRWTEVTSVATVVGAVASLVGTAVGAFFGVQVGAVGKERAEASHERSEEMARVSLSVLPSESAQQLRCEMNQ
jgi:hypothetical protein